MKSLKTFLPILFLALISLSLQKDLSKVTVKTLVSDAYKYSMNHLKEYKDLVSCLSSPLKPEVESACANVKKYFEEHPTEDLFDSKELAKVSNGNPLVASAYYVAHENKVIDFANEKEVEPLIVLFGALQYLYADVPYHSKYHPSDMLMKLKTWTDQLKDKFKDKLTGDINEEDSSVQAQVLNAFKQALLLNKASSENKGLKSKFLQLLISVAGHDAGHFGLRNPEACSTADIYQDGINFKSITNTDGMNDSEAKLYELNKAVCSFKEECKANTKRVSCGAQFMAKASGGVKQTIRETCLESLQIMEKHHAYFTVALVRQVASEYKDVGYLQNIINQNIHKKLRIDDKENRFISDLIMFTEGFVGNEDKQVLMALVKKTTVGEKDEIVEKYFQHPNAIYKLLIMLLDMNNPVSKNSNQSVDLAVEVVYEFSVANLHSQIHETALKLPNEEQKQAMAIIEFHNDFMEPYKYFVEKNSKEVLQKFFNEQNGFVNYYIMNFYVAVDYFTGSALQLQSFAKSNLEKFTNEYKNKNIVETFKERIREANRLSGKVFDKYYEEYLKSLDAPVPEPEPEKKKLKKLRKALKKKY